MKPDTSRAPSTSTMMPTADPTDRQMMLMALPMDKLIVTYCDCTDDASSANMAQELYKLGFDRDKVKVLSGGSLRWVELKYPMVAISKRLRMTITIEFESSIVMSRKSHAFSNNSIWQALQIRRLTNDVFPIRHS